MAHPPCLGYLTPLGWLASVPTALADATAIGYIGSHIGGGSGLILRSNGNPASYPADVAGTCPDTGDLGTNYTDGAYVFAHTTPTTNTGTSILQVGDGSVGCQITITFDYSANTISAYRGTASGTLLGSASGGAAFNRGAMVWNEVQVVWTINASTGTVWVRMNSTVVLNLTSQNTRNTANTRWNRLIVSSQGSEHRFDNPAWFDMSGYTTADLNYVYRVFAAVPSADNSVQFGRDSGASNFSRLASADGDSSYTVSGTAGHVDRFDVSSSWVSTGAMVLAVRVGVQAKIDDATAYTARLKLWSGGTVWNGTSFSVPTTYTFRGLSISDMLLNDPNTAAPWGTGNAVQTVDIGYEIVSSP